MKNSILAVILFGSILTGCSNSDNKPTSENETATPTETKVETQSNTLTESQEPVSDLTEAEAYEFAKTLYKKINSDERFVKDAFELKEYNTLSKYVLSDWFEYTNQPHRYYPKAQVSYGSKYFPQSDAVSPYTACDTAFGDLFLYANAMQHLLREDTAVSRKILRQEEEDYLKSKARCKERVDMTYEQAVTAEENE